MQDKKCGYVAFLGRPNAGKSTLMNACIGTKLSVVSAKPQTTRNRILGICPVGNTQILFLDTPGIQNATDLPKLNLRMTSTAWSVVADANFVCYLVDAAEGWSEEDTIFFRALLNRAIVPVRVVATKSDKTKVEVVEAHVRAMAEQIADCQDAISKELAAESQGRDKPPAPVLFSNTPMPLSAKRPNDVQQFKQFLAEQMPAGPWLFDADDLTDRPQQFVCGELIREQLFRQLGQELPYAVAVKVERFENRGRLALIQATVIVHKDNHKAMVIGSRGARIKAIGQAARLSLERHLERQVHLELFVKVQANWIDSDRLLAEYAGLDKLED